MNAEQFRRDRAQRNVDLVTQLVEAGKRVPRDIVEDMRNDLRWLLSQSDRSDDALPAWVGEFLNRRTDVEHVLREKERQGESVSPEQARQLADKLSVPAEFKPR